MIETHALVSEAGLLGPAKAWAKRNKNQMTSIEQALKPLLRAGLLAVLGDPAEAMGGLLDDWAERLAPDLHTRLLKQVADHANALVLTDNLAPERLQFLLPTIEGILRRDGVRPDEWCQAQFGADRATATVLERAGSSLRGFSDDEVEVIRLLLNAFHASLLTEHDTLERTEAPFRSLVLKLLIEIAQRPAPHPEIVLDLAAAALVGLDQVPWRPGISPPRQLLRADVKGAVPFHGRRDEMESIGAWCDGAGPIGVRLYTGAGGMGKTRLFIELCQRLQARRWRTGFLDHRAATAPTAMWPKLVHHPDPLFLVVDYAETRRKELAPLLQEVFKIGDDRRVRIALLARAAGDWWDELKREGEGVQELLTGPATQRFSLGSLALNTEDRCRSYHMALTTFTDRLKPEKLPPDDPPEDLDSKLFDRVLLLHMSALAAIDGVAVEGEQGILDYVLLRERRFWSKRAKVKGLSSLLEPGVAQAMAVLTLGGGARTRDDAMAVFKQIPQLQDQEAAVLNGISILLHETYPGARWIEPILPDLLGEHLVQVEVEKDPDALFDLVFGTREADTVASPGP